MEIILPPIQGTTFTIQSPPFSSIGVFESSIPLCPGSSSASGIRFVVSVNNQLLIKKGHHDDVDSLIALKKLYFLGYNDILKLSHQ